MANSMHFRFIKFLMIFSGTWRLKLESSSELRQSCYNIYSFVVQFYFCLFVTSLFLQLPVVWQENKAKLFENLGVSIFCVIMVMKILLCQSKNITTLLSRIMDDEQKILQSGMTEDMNIHQEQAKYTDRVNFSVTLYTYALVGIPLPILNYISYLQFEKSHAMMNTTESKPLPYVSWFPFDANEYYSVAFGMDSLAAFMGSTYNSLTQLFFITIMTFMIGRLRILQRHFRNFDTLGEETHLDPEEGALRTLKVLVKEHLEIIECVEYLDKSMRYLMLLEFLMNSIQVASLLIQLLTMEPNIVILFTLNYLGMVVYQIFLLAWHANEIKEQSLELSKSLYESRWYEHSVWVRKNIHIMMMRSQKPLTLQIGAFYPMTMNTALSTMKAAYSYVTILRN